MKNSSIHKRKLAMLALCVLFILTTFLGLSMFTSNAATVASTHTLRFKQVVLGGDFALAVDYEGGLYGWSLLSTAKANEFSDVANESATLGEYYPSTPTKLNFAEKVKMVAATRYNAALVTEPEGANGGKVYTWGSVQEKNITNSQGGYGQYRIMHLREAGNYHTPGKVDSNHYLLNSGSGGLSNMFNGTVTEVYGAEENFVIKSVGAIGAWGSNIFGQLATSTQEYGISANVNYLNDYSTKWSTYSGLSNVPMLSASTDMYIGKDYIMAAPNNRSLYMTGKNFYLNADTDNRTDLNDFNSFALSSTQSNKSASVYIEFDNDAYGTIQDGAYGTFASVNGVTTTAANAVTALLDADGKNVTTGSLRNERVAAGAGFMYYINDAKVYMLGNGYANQAGNGNKAHYDANQRIGSISNAVQVVAGRNTEDAGHLVGTGQGQRLFSFTTDTGASMNIAVGDSAANTLTSVNKDYADFAADTPYISAALGADGTVYAWNASENVQNLNTVLALLGRERIASLAGGYGYNLYGLTTTGKLIKISYDEASADFFAQYHNEFYDATDMSKPIERWNTESKRRTVNFNNASTTGAYAKVYIDRAETSGISAAQVGLFDDAQQIYEHNVDGNFVALNNTADPIRFLLDGRVDERYFVSSTAAADFVAPSASAFAGSNQVSGTPIWEGTDAAIKFYYDYDKKDAKGDSLKRQIADDDLAQILDFKIEVKSGTLLNGANDIGFCFIPKKATINGAITMEFMVARYDNAQEYQVTDPVVYERRVVALDIIIGYSAGTLTHLTDDSQAFQGIIPLLDVNGTRNKSFSVAAMDVSTGFEELGKELERITGTSGIEDQFVNRIHAKLTGGVDKGFPSSEYADELSYYDVNNLNYYNSRYRYFAGTIDGSLMYISSLRLMDTSTVYRENYADFVSATRRNISVTVSLRELFGYQTTAEWQTAVGVADSKAKIINDYIKQGKFNNQYGFYLLGDEAPADGSTVVSGIELTTGGDLKLTYQVITFEATTRATDSVTYPTNEINKPNIQRGTTTDFLNYGVQIREYRVNVGKFEQGRSEWLDVLNQSQQQILPQYVTIHTQASLKLKSDVIDGQVSGKPGENFARYNPNGKDATSVVWSISIGEQSEYSVDLTDLMQIGSLSTEDFVYRFSYGNKTPNSDQRYEDFTKSFNQSVIDPSKTYLSTSKLSFFFLEPTSTTFRINITRVFRSGGATFQYEENGVMVDAEMVVLEFSIKADVTTSFKKSVNATRKVALSDRETISVSDVVAFDHVASVDYIAFSEALITNTGTATAKIISGQNANDTIEIRAVASGVTFLRYSVTLLGRHKITGEVEIEVRYISEYRSEANPLSVTDREKVQISDISTFLRGENVHLGLTNLPVDLTAGTNGVTIQVKDPTTSVWSDVAVSETTYIQSVTIEPNDGTNPANGTHLFIILKSVAQGETIGVYRVLVHFATDTAEGKVELIASIVLSPGHTDLTVKMGGGEDITYRVPLLIDVLYQDGYRSNLTGTLQSYEQPVYAPDSSDQKMLTVPIAYFFSEEITGKKPGEGGRNFADYAITKAFIDDSRVEAKDTLKYLTCDPAKSGAELQIRPLFPTAEIAANNPDTIDGIRVTVSFTSTKQQSSRDSFQVSFYISVSQIKMTLSLAEWGTVYTIAGASVFGLLFLVFVVRMIIYLRRRAEQKRIIKKNQMLIRMRDKMHHSSGTPSRMQAVKAKMKINDPKYAKMFDEMRRQKEAETGITLDNSAIAQKAENTSRTMDRVKASKKSKKKSKKSIDDLKAELEAKRSALAQMQVGVPGGGANMDDGEISMDPSIIESAPVFDSYNAELSREDVEDQIKAKLEGGGFVEYEPLGSDEDML